MIHRRDAENAETFRAMHLFGWRKDAYCIASGEFWHLLKFGLLCPKSVLFFLIGCPDQEKAFV